MLVDDLFFLSFHLFLTFGRRQNTTKSAVKVSSTPLFPNTTVPCTQPVHSSHYYTPVPYPTKSEHTSHRTIVSYSTKTVHISRYHTRIPHSTSWKTPIPTKTSKVSVSILNQRLLYFLHFGFFFASRAVCGTELRVPFSTTYYIIPEYAD